MMIEQPQFNLVDRPWIPVVDGGHVREVSLREALTEAHAFGGLDTAEPLEAVALLRQVLLPVLFDACGLPTSDKEWGSRWLSASLDAERINAYLDEHRDRFDLFDPVAPFAQVAGLATAKGETKPASILIAAEPAGNNVPLFGARTEADPRALSPARAARVLLATHCFDTAAIKSGAVGDPFVQGGKTTGNPTGSVGQLGVCVPVGETLQQTLLLNSPIEAQGLRREDRPQWRRGVQTPEWTTRAASGLLDLLTFQSRRVRLILDDAEERMTVSRVVVSAGDRLSPIPENEPHTQWRRVAKPKASDPPRRPVRFAPGKAAWRGLTSLLATSPNADGTQTTPLVVQVADLRGAQYLPLDFPLMIHTTGVAYGNQSAVVEDVIFDSVPVPVAALMADSEVHGLVLEVVDQAELLLKAANNLDDTLRRASGGDAIPWDKSQRLGDVLIHSLGGLAHRLLLGLQRSPEMVDEAEAAWRNAARSAAFAVAEQALASVPPTAFLGRPGRSEKYPDRASDAEARFRRTVHKILPALEMAEPEGVVA